MLVPSMPVPRVLRTASFRLAALYVAVFAVSACVLGAAVFLAARSALQEQMTARIEAEATFLQGEFRAGGLDQLLAAIRSRGRGVTALDYLVQDAAGAHLAGEMPAAPRQPGCSDSKWLLTVVGFVVSGGVVHVLDGASGHPCGWRALGVRGLP